MLDFKSLDFSVSDDNLNLNIEFSYNFHKYSWTKWVGARLKIITIISATDWAQADDYCPLVSLLSAVNWKQKLTL